MTYQVVYARRLHWAGERTMIISAAAGVKREAGLEAVDRERLMTSADFIQLLRESVITQATITILVVGAVVGLVIVGRPVPNEMWNIVSLVVGFYFGGKVQTAAMQAAKRAALELWEYAEGRPPRRGGPQE